MCIKIISCRKSNNVSRKATLVMLISRDTREIDRAGRIIKHLIGLFHSGLVGG